MGNRVEKIFTILLFITIIAFNFFLFQKLLQTQKELELVKTSVQILAKSLEQAKLISSQNKYLIKELLKKQDAKNSQEDALISVIEKATDSVVSIVVSKYVPLLKVEYVNPFGDSVGGIDFRMPVFKQVGKRKEKISAGTGFIFREDGYIITNKHVIVDPNANYTVLLSDGRKKQARLVYIDNFYDFAILKIDGKYKPLELGDSSKLKLGQTVIAIGNALGEYNNSVSVGIVSGLHRDIEVLNPSTQKLEMLKDVIQTDAAINKGNSGGPLIDLKGKVVGINVAMQLYANDIAFAIPINAIKPILKHLEI